MKLVVLGCGPTGLGLAYHLQKLWEDGNTEATNVEMTIIEKEAEAGGLASTVEDDKGFLWDFGIHATFSHYQYYDEALDWAVKDWNFQRRNAKLDMSYLFKEKEVKLLPYPVQFTVPLFPEAVRNKCMSELKAMDKSGLQENDEGLSYDAWVLRSFGETLANVFFRPYNKKLWTVDIKEMNSVWVGERVAKVDLQRLEDLCLMDKEELEAQDYGWGPNAQFRYPKYGGVGSVWKGIQKNLPLSWFRFNNRVVSLDPINKSVTVTDKSDNVAHYSYDVLVSTIPITILGQISGLAPRINLKHNRVIVVGIGLKPPQPDWMKTKSWLYFPGDDVPFYRLSMLSNFSRYLTPEPGHNWSLLLEVGRSPQEDGQE